MHAKDLIGKKAIRYVPTNKGDYSFSAGKGVKITNVTDTHVYINPPELGNDIIALGSEFLTGWVEYEPYPKAGTSEQCEWTSDCPKCGSCELEQVPGSIVLTLDPPIYCVRCKKCAAEFQSQKCSETHTSLKNKNFKPWTVGDIDGVSIVNTKPLEGSK